MSKNGKELPYEARILIAFLLSVVVMVGWSYVFPPTPPKRTPPAQTAPAQALPQPSAGSGQAGAQPETQPQAAAAGQAAAAQPAPDPAKPAQLTAAPAAATTVPVVQAAQEQSLTVENGEYRVRFSNRGAVVQSWQLLNYKNSEKEQEILDVVDAEAAQALGAWPLSISVADLELNKKLPEALYEMTPAPGVVKAPAEVVFRWSDGETTVTKRLRFDESYVVEVFSLVERGGKPVDHSIAWRGGFGDRASYMHHEQTLVIYRTGGALHTLPSGNLGQAENREQWMQQPEMMDYAGLADRYFAAAFIAPSAGAAGGPVSGPGLVLWHSKRDHKTTINEKQVTVPLAEVAIGAAATGPIEARLFVGPKDLEVLARQRPPMTDLVDFGWDWIEPISKLLFLFLKWIHGYVPNWGWSIVLMTVAIITLMYPLKVKSWRSMQKMQKLMPEMQQIKQRYAKFKLTDPRKQQEQQEMMALYKKHGMSPVSVGGCLPMLLQMPVWFALYQMLGAAIELRHAPWLWVRDLSAHDPYYVLPVFMAVSMYASQKMTPVTTADPAQARMMNMMPVIFGGMFVIFPVSSGLVLYIFTSMLVGMAQQWYLNKTNPIKKPSDNKEKK